MLASLYSGVSGLKQFQQGMDVIGNNIANVNTTGFKGARSNFADTFSEIVGETGSGSALQVGTGAATSSITSYFGQGNITGTGANTDLAIEGDGFFVVREASTGVEFLTRAGDFDKSVDGYLQTHSGLRLQGFSDAGLSTRGDVQIDGTGSGAAADATVEAFSIDAGGTIHVRMSDGTEFVRGQVLLQSVRAPQNLVKEGNNLYSGMAFAGPLAQTAAPGSTGLGQLTPNALEMSNVDLATEMSSLIVTQRAFQANARIITTSDEVLQELVNLKR